MEEEEKEAQSAKLQELIRRGTPEDLQEANRLMKVMAGYDTRSKTDYRAKAAAEVSKIQAKARLLEENLANFKPGDKMTEGDVFEELAAALSSAQPKIQKMCEEESDDHEAVAKLLEINDSIHRTVERWKLLKKGDIEGANKIAAGAPVPSSQPSAQAGSSSAANELSLIDFDAEAPQPNGPSGESGSSQAGVENDLLGLSLEGGSNGTFGQGGGISLGFGTNTSKSERGFLPLTKPRLTKTVRYPRPAAAVFYDAELDGVEYCHVSYAAPLFAVRWLRFTCVWVSIEHTSAPSSLRLWTTTTEDYSQACRPVRCSRIFPIRI